MCEDILKSMRTSDLSGSGSQSVGSELLKIRDPTTGRGTLMATCNPLWSATRPYSDKLVI